MGTVLILTAFLLAASANPIEQTFDGNSIEAPAGTDEDVSGSVHHPINDSALPTTNEHYTQNHGEDKDINGVSNGGSGEDQTSNSDAENASPSPVSSVPTSTTMLNTADDDEDTNTETGPTGEPGEDQTDNNDTDNASSSSLSSVPTSTTKLQDSKQETNDTVTPPPDADPVDCRNATELHHSFMLCTYSCQGDQMFTAPDKSPCYLNETEIRLQLFGVRSRMATTSTGVCMNGNCVTPGELNETETSTTIQTTTASTTTSPIAKVSEYQLIN